MSYDITNPTMLLHNAGVAALSLFGIHYDFTDGSQLENMVTATNYK